MCKQSVRHVSTTKYLWSIVSIGRQRLVKSCFFCFLFFSDFFFNSHYLEKSFHGPGAKTFYKNLKKCPWTRPKMVVRGPCPYRVFTDPGPCFVLTRSKWLPSHTKFFSEFSFSPFPLCTSIWLPGKFFMGAFSRTKTNDNLYNLRDWSHHFVFSALYLLLFSPSPFEKMCAKFKREMLYCAWWWPPCGIYLENKESGASLDQQLIVE